MKNPVLVGYDNNNVPVYLYFNDGYKNKRLEFSIDSKTWKVYFYCVAIGFVNEEGDIKLNAESID